MLNQKDNDFDDLFRRASERYPLRTDSADWDRMAAALDNPSSTELTEVITEERRRRRRFLWLFLLLPLGGAGYFVFHSGGTGGAGVTGQGVTGVTGHGATGVTGQGATGVTGHGESGVTRQGAAYNAEATGKNEVLKPAASEASKAPGELVTPKVGSVVEKGRTWTGGDVVVNGKRKNRVRSNGGGLRNEEGGMRNDGGGLGNDGGGLGSDGAAAGRVAGYPVNRVGTRGDYRLSVDVVEPPIAKDSGKGKPKASRRQKSSFLYAGLMAAPDLSTVKFQHTDGVGTTFSLLLGYQFNKKWAIETGVSLDRKKYYSSGEYVDAKHMGVPAGWDVKNMDGICYMWEIPINVRYNFSQSDKTSWFATAGLSTYLMTRENYNYTYYYNGSGPSPWSRDIRTPSSYWFSIINLSAGYEHRIGNIGNLRIEPYLRIPMAGLGSGRLSILSSGLNIGITRRLW